MKHLLIPVDGSDGAARAARFGAELARELRAKISLLYVYDAPTASAMGLARSSPEELERAKLEVSRGSFESAVRVLGDTIAEHHVAIGHPAQEIVTFANENGVDMIVMGSRGLSPVEGVLLGSVSDRVLHRAKCPVTIVH